MRVIVVILIAFLTSVLTTFGSVYAIGHWKLLKRQEAKQPVPSLIGLKEADARTNLDALGFKLMVGGRKPSTEAAPGTVVEQKPEAGGTVEPGGAVTVVFAVAPPEVPDVVGRPVEEAKTALKAAGYAVTVDEATPSADYEEGAVTAQDPEAGTPLEKGGEVTLKPSAGKGEVEVPKLVGQGVNKAKKIAEEAGVELKVQWVALAETATYVVLRQTPAPGEKIEAGAEVTAVVNR